MVIVLYIGVGEFLSENGFEDICIPEDVEKKIVGFAMTFLILNLLLQLGVVVDSCWGWARLRRRMVTLVPWKTNSIQPENNLELGGVQVEEQRGENTEEKVHARTAHATHILEKIFFIKS